MLASTSAIRPWKTRALLLLTTSMLCCGMLSDARADEPASGVQPSGEEGGEDIGELFLRALLKEIPDAAQKAEQQEQDTRTQRAWEQFLLDEKQVQERILNAYKGRVPEGTPFDWANRYSYGLSGGVNQAVNDYIDAMQTFERDFSQILAGAQGMVNVVQGHEGTKETAKKIDLAAAVAQLTVGVGKLGYGGYQWWRAGRAGAEALGAADDAVKIVDEVAASADDVTKTVTLPGQAAQGVGDAASSAARAEDAVGTARLPGAAASTEDAVGTVVVPGQAARGAGDAASSAARAEDAVGTVVNPGRAAGAEDAVGTMVVPGQAGRVAGTAPTTAAELLKDDPHIAEWAAKAGVNVDEIIESVYAGMRGHNPAKDEQALERVIMAIVERYGYHRLGRNLQDALEYGLSNLEIAIGQGKSTANIAEHMAVIRQYAGQFGSVEDFLRYLSKAYDVHGFDTGVELVFTPERLALLRELLKHGDDVNAIRKAMGPVRAAGLSEAAAGVVTGVSSERVATGVRTGLDVGGVVEDGLASNVQASTGSGASSDAPGAAAIRGFEQVVQDSAVLDQAGGLSQMLDDFGLIGRLQRKGYFGTVVGDAVGLLLSPGETATDYFYTFGMLDAYEEFQKNYSQNIDRMSTAYHEAVRALEHLDMVLRSFRIDDPESVLGGKGAAELQDLLKRMTEIFNDASSDWQCEHQDEFKERWNHITQKKRDIENAVTQLRAFAKQLPAIRQSLEAFAKGGRSGLDLFQPAVYMRILSIGVLLDAQRASALGMSNSPLLKLLSDNQEVAAAAEGNPQVSVTDSLDGYLTPDLVSDTLFVDNDRGLLWGSGNDLRYIPFPCSCPQSGYPLFVAGDSSEWCTYGSGEPLQFLLYDLPTEGPSGENRAPGPAMLPDPAQAGPSSPSTPSQAPPSAGSPDTAVSSPPIRGAGSLSLNGGDSSNNGFGGNGGSIFSPAGTPIAGGATKPKGDSADEPKSNDRTVVPNVTIYFKATRSAMGQGGTVPPAPGYTANFFAPVTVDPRLPGEGVAKTQTDHDQDPISAVTDDKGRAMVRFPAPPGLKIDKPLNVEMTLPTGPTHSRNIEIPRGSTSQLPLELDDFITDELTIGNSTFVTLFCNEDQRALLDDLIRGLPNVISVQENFCDDKRNSPGDPYYLKQGSDASKGSWGQNYDDQWAIKQVGLTPENKDFWKKTEAGKPVVVAVIDTGLDWHHADFDWRNLWRNEKEIPDNGVDDDKNGYVDDIIGWDFYGRNNKPWDHDGHGTLITGIIAAAHNDIGIAGVNPHARIMVLKAVNNFGHSRASYLSKALVYAADNGAQVVNMSVGGGYTSIMEERAVEYALSKGVTIVVAGGNEGKSTEGDGTASHPGVITVASTDWNDKRVGFSNWGPGVSIAAPGMDVLSLRARRTDTMLHIKDVDYEKGANYVGPDKRYYRASGTSFSAPIVAGAASLLLSVQPKLTPEQVRRMLLQNAKDIETPGIDQLTGYGLLDIPASLAADPEFFVDARITGVQVVQEKKKTLLNVQGTADADRFRQATLHIGIGDDPSKWKQVDTIKRAVQNGLLGSIPAGEFSGAKVWTIRLTTEHRSGKKREFYFRLTTG